MSARHFVVLVCNACKAVSAPCAVKTTQEARERLRSLGWVSLAQRHDLCPRCPAMCRTPEPTPVDWA